MFRSTKLVKVMRFLRNLKSYCFTGLEVCDTSYLSFHRGISSITCKVMSILDVSYVVLCTIWYHLYNLKNVKNTYGGVLLLVKLQAYIH